jgi:2-polyprenyl-3-methyl-5-hydroxy-6-metoxy-1,4-benzoquinol methylase
MFGKKEILEQMITHSSAQVAFSKWQRNVAKSFGYIIIKIFGYPLNDVERVLLRSTINYFKNKPIGKILDVGCSHGVYDFELAKQGHTILGIDINIDSINIANKIKKSVGMNNIQFICADIIDYKINENFDYIIIYEALEHIQNDSALIKKLYGLLRKNGILIVSVPYAKDILEYDQPVGACKDKNGNFEFIAEGGGHYRNGYNVDSLSYLLTKNGFSILEKHEQKRPKKIIESMALFPITYPLLLLDKDRWGDIVKVRVIATKH